VVVTPTKARDCCLLQIVQTRSGAHLPSHSRGIAVLSWTSSISIALSFTVLLTVCFHKVDTDKFTFCPFFTVAQQPPVGHNSPQWATTAPSEPQQPPVGHNSPQWATTAPSGSQQPPMGHNSPQWVTTAPSGPQQPPVGQGLLIIED